MANRKREPVLSYVLDEINQSHETRKKIFTKIEEDLKRPLVSLFTSFRYPVGLETDDADMLEGILQKLDLANGLALLVSSPGGDGLAAERIINICRSYSGTGEYWTIVPSKAKSAATMICFGASEIIMSPTSELGPIDPQLFVSEGKQRKAYSVWNIVKSYDELFRNAIKEKGNLEPYLQQLSRYDSWDIEEFRTSISLSEDIAIRSLANGMMKGNSKSEIKKNIEMFLTPEKTKSHGRPIYEKEAQDCGLNIELLDVKSNLYKTLYELYIRTNHFVSSRVSKCIESRYNSYVVNAEA